MSLFGNGNILPKNCSRWQRWTHSGAVHSGTDGGWTSTIVSGVVTWCGLLCDLCFTADFKQNALFNFAETSVNVCHELLCRASPAPPQGEKFITAKCWMRKPYWQSSGRTDEETLQAESAATHPPPGARQEKIAKTWTGGEFRLNSSDEIIELWQGTEHVVEQTRQSTGFCNKFTES